MKGRVVDLADKSPPKFAYALGKLLAPLILEIVLSIYTGGGSAGKKALSIHKLLQDLKANSRVRRRTRSRRRPPEKENDSELESVFGEGTAGGRVIVVVPQEDRIQLRRNLSIAKGDTDWQGHHIIPWEFIDHYVFQILKSTHKWDHNSALNGIKLPTKPGVKGAGNLPIHKGEHSIYNWKAFSKLEELKGRYLHNEINDDELYALVLAAIADWRKDIESGRLSHMK
jgi:hypothetical protein